MKKRIITLATLFASLIILGGAYFVFQFTRPSPEQPPEQPVAELIRLVSVDPFAWEVNQTERNRLWQDVVSLGMAVHGEEEIKLERNRDGVWYSTKRPHLTLEQDFVIFVLDAFAQLEAAEVFIEDPDRQIMEQLGLYPPRATVTVEYNDGAVYTAFIGELTVDGQFRYIMVEGVSSIYLINPSNVFVFFGGYNIFVDRSLPMVDVWEIVSMQVYRRDLPPIYLEMFDMEMFEHIPYFFGINGLTMVSPIPNQPIVHDGLHYQIISHLNNMAHPDQISLIERLIELNPEDLSVYGLDDPTLEIKIELVNGEVYHLRIGNEIEARQGGAFYVMFEGLDGVWEARSIMIFPLLEINPFMMIFNFISFAEMRYVDRIELYLTEHGYIDILIEHYFAVREVEEEERHNINVTVNGESFTDAAMRRFYVALLGLSRENVLEAPITPEGEPIEWMRHHLQDGTVIHNEFFEFSPAFYGISTNGGDIYYLISRQALANINRDMYLMQNRLGVFRER